MITVKINKTILFSVFFLYSLQAQSLIEDVVSTKKSEGFQHASWGIYAEFTDTGEEIINSDGHLSLAPASNLKLFTTAAALHFLGEDFRFYTSVFVRGNINSNGILDGDIIIRGGGDPTLGSNKVRGSLPLDSVMGQWVNAVKSMSIKQVTGSVIADESFFEGNGLPDYYPWIDMGNYYGASTSALTIHDNLYYLYFKPGNKEGESAEVLRTEPVIPGLTFINHMKTGPKGSGDNGYIYSAPLHNTGILRGTIPTGVKEFSIKGSIPNSALFAVQYFTGYLNRNDVIVEGVPFVTDAPVDYNNLKNIHVTSSPPLKDIVYIINKKSDNLYTEQVLRMIGVKEFSEGSFRGGIKTIRKCLGELNVSEEGLRLFDGSGLSRNNMITPQMMGNLLSALSEKPYFESFYNSLGIAGDPDDISSFRNFGANSIIALNARIKSGTVNGVRGHSGYVKARSGRLISFSFIANNFTASSGKVNEAHIRWLQKIAERN